jgi:hypothetical protein
MVQILEKFLVEIGQVFPQPLYNFHTITVRLPDEL